MDKIAQSANQSRSVRGSAFEDKIEALLVRMKKSNKIREFTRKPVIFDGEFRPDFVVEKNNGNIISIDSTTTARTDRLRAKQWDAHGTKLYFSRVKKKKVGAVVVVDEINTSQREKDNFRLCKARCRLPYSALDDTVSVSELVKLLTNV